MVSCCHGAGLSIVPFGTLGSSSSPKITSKQQTLELLLVTKQVRHGLTCGDTAENYDFLADLQEIDVC